MIESIYKGKRIYRGKSMDELCPCWEVGFVSQETDAAYITTLDGKKVMVFPETVGAHTWRLDMYDEDLFEGDIIEAATGDKLLICFGEYMSYCFHDEQECRSMGFYAKNIDDPDCSLMPLGETEQYATLLGNITFNPELLEKE